MKQAFESLRPEFGDTKNRKHTAARASVAPQAIAAKGVSVRCQRQREPDTALGADYWTFAASGVTFG
jgi:hypothetical protein